MNNHIRVTVEVDVYCRVDDDLEAIAMHAGAGAQRALRLLGYDADVTGEWAVPTSPPQPDVIQQESC